MYIVAGAILEHVTGTSWETFLRNRLFAPLGITRSGFTGDQRPNDAMDAVGHACLRGRIRPWLQTWGHGVDMSMAMGRPCGPEGSIISTVSDLCRWLLLHIAQGHIADRSVLQTAQIRELHCPQVVIPSFLREPEMLDSSYAMGWICQPYRGHRWLYHLGGGNGSTSFLSFMPDRRVGVVVLINIEKPSMVPIMIALTIYDRLLGLSSPWARRWGRTIRQQETDARKQQEPRRYKGMKISEHLSKPYLGEYQHPGYGRVSVCRPAGRLQLRFNVCRFGLQRSGPYTFELIPHGSLPWWGKRQARFLPGKDGRMRAVILPFEPSIPKLVFRRRRSS